MNPTQTKEWAKEMVLGAIDHLIKEMDESPESTLEEEQAIKLQRNRVAKFLGLKEKA